MIVNNSSKNWLKKQKNKVKIDIILKTNGKYISVTYGCIKLLDIY